MDPRLKKILGYAILAPSGDNCQPWRFTVDGLKVELFNDSGRDSSLYNLGQRASLVAHGAFLENLLIAAPSEGLKCQVELFPRAGDPNHIASLAFTESQAQKSPLLDAMNKRHTNRERYAPVRISDSQLRSWKSLPEIPGQNIWISTRANQIAALAQRLACNDRLVFEVPELHRFLFEQIRWTDVEAQRSGDGLDIKTLGLGAADRIAFKLFQNRRIVSTLNRAGLSKIIEFKAKNLLKTASAMAAIGLPGTAPQDYIDGGRLWQRLLLQLARENLTAQPVAGLAFLVQSAYAGELAEILPAAQNNFLRQLRKELLKLTGMQDQTVILAMFRIGKGPNVTRSLRRPLESFFKR
jgi:hypothetical protein